MPLRPVALLTIAALSVVLAFSLQIFPFGIFLALILLSWLFKYSFTFLDQLVSGSTEAPVLSLPAVFAVQGWTGRLEHSFDYRVCRVMIATLGADYAWIVGITFALVAACVAAAEYSGPVSFGLLVGVSIYAWLAFIAVIGGALRAQRDLLQQEIPLVIPHLQAVSPQQLAADRERWLYRGAADWRPPRFSPLR